MRHLEWTLVIVVLAAFLAPLACGAQDAAPAGVGEIQDYAQREAVELEDFQGGNGLVVLVVLLAAVIVLVAVILPW